RFLLYYKNKRMGLFSRGQKNGRYGVLLDIGSGSVLAAIVHSDPAKPHPVLVWSKREHVPLRDSNSIEESAKAVMSALVNASMTLDAEGRAILRQYDPGAQLSELQCGISAPWSYTVTKSITYEQKEVFTVTDELLKKLTDTAEHKITSELKENESVENLGLTIVNRSTMDISTNGYRVTHPQGEKAKELVLSHASVVAQTYLIEAINEMREKLFPETKLTISSYMLMLYSVLRNIFPNQHDYCAVDLTYEATEIGVVRDGSLRYCTHTPIGLFSIAREISAITGVPVHEAYTHLRSSSFDAFMERLSATKQAEIEEMFEDYTSRIADLFHETGDRLAIPKNICIHTELNSEPIMAALLTKAGIQALKTQPLITKIASKIHADMRQAGIATSQSVSDEALYVAAAFFHTPQVTQTFTIK
ncbi:hypothetical protein KC887_05650, partial [Candidatus Kaiserbacteria bacterium]|nr:hypothetical protein [Candidatus Kaiserbacteria bacterium]